MMPSAGPLRRGAACPLTPTCRIRPNRGHPPRPGGTGLSSGAGTAEQHRGAGGGVVGHRRVVTHGRVDRRVLLRPGGAVPGPGVTEQAPVARAAAPAVTTLLSLMLASFDRRRPAAPRRRPLIRGVLPPRMT